MPANEKVAAVSAPASQLNCKLFVTGLINLYSIPIDGGSPLRITEDVLGWGNLFIIS